MGGRNGFPGELEVFCKAANSGDVISDSLGKAGFISSDEGQWLLLPQRNSEFWGSVFPASSGCCHMIPFEFSGACSFPISAAVLIADVLTVKVGSSICVCAFFS